MNRTQTLNLPVGDAPDWEIAGLDELRVLELKNPTESFVILQSLKQSREKWIRMTFPKFSSRARGGKQPDVVPPPHTMYNRGRCTLEIGPHVFTDTTIFEVHYHPAQVPTTASTTFFYQAAGSGSWQPGTSSTSAAPGQKGESSSTPSSTPALTQSAPSFLTFPSAGTIAPGLISQVNTAANSNPTLANLLQLAAAGKASSDQLKTLGLLIQSLANSTAMATDVASPQANAPRPESCSTIAHVATALSLPPQFQTLTREFDLVLEFKEAPSDRWLFPRGPAICEFTPTPATSGTIGTIMLSTVIPFTTGTLPDAAGSHNPVVPDSIPKETVAFHFSLASSYIWESISRWVGSQEKLEENRNILTDIKPPERKFLAHRLPDSSQLTQIQNAAAHSFTMKPIKPATNCTRPKRRSRSRKSLQGADAPPSLTTKRRRQSQPPKVQNVPTPISCFSCGQTDVPLILGGRYCRPCVEAGLGREIPKVGGIGSYKSCNESERPHDNLPSKECTIGQEGAQT